MDYDEFLNGKIKIKQPVTGFRSGMDAVFLAASISGIKSGQKVLEVGCAAGASLFCLRWRLLQEKMNLHYKGIDKQPALIALAHENMKLNNAQDDMSFEVENILHPSADFKNKKFDIVMTNPPFYEKGSVTLSENAQRKESFEEEGNLRDWILACRKKISPKGRLFMIHLAERMPEIMAILDQKFGNIHLFPLFTKPNQPAKRILISAQLDTKAKAQIHQGMMIRDQMNSDTSDAQAVLRQGAGLIFS